MLNVLSLTLWQKRLLVIGKVPGTGQATESLGTVARLGSGIGQAAVTSRVLQKDICSSKRHFVIF